MGIARVNMICEAYRHRDPKGGDSLLLVVGSEAFSDLGFGGGSMRMLSGALTIRSAGLLLVIHLGASGASAQTAADQETLRRLPKAHCDAWNKRDAHADGR